MKRLLSALLLTSLAPAAHAALVGFTFDAGPVTYIETGFVDPQVAEFQNFQMGESVLVSFTIDDATPDLDPLDQRGEFEDPNGTITLTGATSGTVITMGLGVNIQLDSVFEFDLRNIFFGPTLHVFELFDDTDYLASQPIVSDPDNLATSIAELQNQLTPDGRFLQRNLAQPSIAAVGVEDSLGPLVALAFGPVASVPAPPVFLLMLTGFATLGAWRARIQRQSANG